MEIEEDEKSRKRMKRSTEEKLAVGEEVEVLFMDEGFAGSWNAGVVIDSGINCRLVEFTHLLSDDKKSQFKQWITVSAAITGGSSSNPENYRGNIRPLQPRNNVRASDMKYGLCVDALVEDAWWEGVVFDEDNDSYEKVIFFPDEGDRQKISIDHLCLTQDWDEVSGCWKPRGEWMLLQVVDTYKKEDVMPVSVRQIWYDLRATDAFLDKIGSWPYGQQHIWHNLVSDLIQILLSVAYAVPLTQRGSYDVTHIPLTSDDVGGKVPTDLQRDDSGCLSERMHVDYNHSFALEEKDVGESRSCFRALSEFIFESRDSPVYPALRRRFIEKRRDAEVHLSAAGWKLVDKLYVSPRGETYSSFIEACEAWIAIDHKVDAHGIMYYNRDKVVPCNTQHREASSRLEDEHNKVEVCSVSAARKSWKIVELQPEYCPDLARICASYVNYGKKKSTSCDIEKLRKHLLHEGWRIESKRDIIHRFRYHSPDGNTYYSLVKVCCALIDQNCRSERLQGGYSGPERPSCMTKNKKHARISKRNVRLHGDREYRLNRVLTNDSRDASGMEYSAGLSESNCALASASVVLNQRACSDGSCSASTKGSRLLNSISLKERTRELRLLKVIKRYVELIEGGQWKRDGKLIENAKKYLKLLGWRLWVRYKTIKKKIKPESNYTSPNGKNYSSLYTACKGFLEEHQQISTGKSAESTNTGRETELQSVTMNSVNGTIFRSCGFFSAANNHSLLGTACVDEEGSMSSANLCKTLLPQSWSKFSNNEKKGKRKGKPRTKQTKRSSRRFSPRLSQSSNRSQLVSEPSTSQHTRKTILSWLIEKDVILPRAKVTYVRKADGCTMKCGRITRDGIKCDCCSKVFSLADFQFHAGCSSPQPAANIFLADGMSLLQHQKELVRPNMLKCVPHERLKRDCSQHEGDYECSICHDGGNLMLCDHCPSAFHPSCVGLEDVPQGNWCCPLCQCGLCGLGEFNCDADQFTCRSMLCCDQCEREYHVGCLGERGLSQPSSIPTGSWVCSKNCAKIYNCIQDLVGKSNPTVEGLSWTILRSSRDNGTDTFDDDEAIAEYHSKLYIALDVLHECFEPLIESRTQSDVVADLLFNRESELRRLNFWGMYTIILEKGDELVCVATFRVYGEKVAEMPFIGTRIQFRRKGMCRLLVNKLEELLSAWGVERFVLPAIPQLLQTWTGSFGFTQMTHADRMELSGYNLLSFQDTPMCQKFLGIPSKISEEPGGSGSTNEMDIDHYNVISEIARSHDTIGENSYQVDLSVLDDCFVNNAKRMDPWEMDPMETNDGTSGCMSPDECKNNSSLVEPPMGLTVISQASRFCHISHHFST